jgi:hypothetical protein
MKPYPPSPKTTSLSKYWSQPVSALAQVTPPAFKLEEKERHRIYCYLLMALLADYWAPKKLLKTTSSGTYAPYLGHNIAALAVNERGGGFKFQVQRVNDGAIAHRLPGASQSRDIFVGAC